MITLDKEKIDKIDLSYAKKLSVKNGLNFDKEAGDEENKVDVTAVGHQSGTGLVEFES